MAVESEREFGLSVLQRLDAELVQRGELFRQAGVNDLASYRERGEREMASERKRPVQSSPGYSRSARRSPSCRASC